MKKSLDRAVSLCCLFLVALACTKDVGLITEVEFEILEEHTSEGFVNQGLPTTFTIVPEAILENYEYTISYEILQGNGYFEDVEGNRLEAGKGQPIESPFTTSLLYMGTEVGEHRVKIVGSDNFGISEEIEITYDLENVPALWEASSELTEIELGKAADIFLLFEPVDTALEVTYEARLEFASGSGTLAPIQEEGYPLDGDYAAIAPGTYPFMFTPSELGTQELVFVLRDSNGQELRETLSFNVVEVIRVISIFLGEDDTIELQLGDEVAPDITFDPPNASDQGFILVSDNPDVVLIDENNVCIAVGLGTAIVTVTSLSNPEATDTVTVTVVEPDRVPASAITIAQEDPDAQGAVRQLIATVLPADATDASVIWSSSDDTVATIDANGLLTGLAAGTVTITATSVSDPGVVDTIEVNISGGSLQDGNDITAFALPIQNSSTIDADTHTITVNVTDGTELNTAPSALSISGGATIDPGIGEVRDFNAAQTYTVTAGNGTAQLWTVNVTVSPPAGSGENDIVSFALPVQTDADINRNDHVIFVNVLEGTELNVIPQIFTVSEGATVSPDITEIQDFSRPVTYTVTAENGEEQIWTIRIVIVPADSNAENEIISFSIPNQVGTSIIDNENATVAIEVPQGIDLTSIVPNEVTLSENAMLFPVATEAQDFTEQFIYVVTAENGVEKFWTVTVTVLPSTGSDENDIIAFSLPVQNSSTIDTVNHTVTVNVTDGTELNVVPLQFTTSNNATIEPSTTQARDFSAPVTYTVISQSGIQQVWTVNTTAAANQPPVAVDDVGAVELGGSVRIDVLANDTDVDTPNAELIISGIIGVQPDNAGSFSEDNDGRTFVFTSSGEYQGDASFGYTVSDGNPGNEDFGQVTITITQTPVSITALNIVPSEYLLEVDETLRLTTEITPNDATNRILTWQSSDPDAVSVDQNGNVTGLQAEGSAIITATTNDGSNIAAEAIIDVNFLEIPVTSVVIDPPSGTLAVGEQLQLNGTTLPADASAAGVDWFSEDEDIATIDGTGLVRGISVGTVNIIADAIDGNGASQTASITVTPADIPLIGISVTPSTASIVEGATVQLGLVFDPTNASNQEVVWSSDNPNTATVDNDGLVRGVEAGTTTVTAISVDDNSIITTAQITVTAENTEPVAGNDSFEVAEGGNLNRPILTNDVDGENDDLTVDWVAGSSANIGQPIGGSNGGLFTISAGGALSFDTNGDFENLNDGESRQTTIDYRVSDGQLSSNIARVTVTVNGSGSSDTTPPEISLIGLDPVELFVNEPYTEEGATAQDDVDGILSNDDISIDNSSVDTTTAGTYLVTYTVSDTAGNVAERFRTVTVSLRSGNDILSFNFPRLTGPPVIDVLNHTVLGEVEFGSSRNASPISLTISEGATINPQDISPQDFSVPVSYTVTAQNGDIQVWTITLAEASAPPSPDFSFSIDPVSSPVSGSVNITFRITPNQAAIDAGIVFQMQFNRNGGDIIADFEYGAGSFISSQLFTVSSGTSSGTFVGLERPNCEFYDFNFTVSNNLSLPTQMRNVGFQVRDTAQPCD
ncbi:DUF5011 domain-containing protein [Aggregatimonas sangjinii]|uniref:DUF5011 domain-containing protein n=1 Tax=Aggregatimonas sangjinii TaxID=2583587 RepID=A0A5B7STK7_9FLAO|nr:Ig-like domain-containing protein [Aggregatimonas sangjinii]QCX00034.1 DUF5011 domain-containing protein [Aggregatimonas sangjinii]